MFSYVWNQFSHKQKKKGRGCGSQTERARKEKREKWKPLTGTRSERETVKSGRCRADRVCLEGTAADWWNESSSSNQRAGRRVIEGRTGDPRARSQRCRRKTGSAWMCVQTHAVLQCFSARSCSCSLSLSRCRTRGSVHRTRVCLFFFSFFLNFCQKKGSLKVRGSAAGQASLPGARQGFDKKFQSTSDVFLPTRKLKKFVFCSTLLC